MRALVFSFHGNHSTLEHLSAFPHPPPEAIKIAYLLPVLPRVERRANSELQPSLSPLTERCVCVCVYVCACVCICDGEGDNANAGCDRSYVIARGRRGQRIHWRLHQA